MRVNSSPLRLPLPLAPSRKGRGDLPENNFLSLFLGHRKYLLFYMKVINISEVSEEVVLAKKAPKNNNVVDSTLRDAAAASLSLSFKLGKEKRIAPDKCGHWEIVND